MLQPQAFVRLIASEGERFRWLQAFPSSSYNPATGLDDRDAATTTDHGFNYVDRGIFKGLVSEQQSSELHPDFGWVAQGTLWLATWPRHLQLAMPDKIVLLARPSFARERLVRNVQLAAQTATDQVGQKYPIDATDVVDDGHTYIRGTDWTFDAATGAVVWTEGGTAPADGATYVVAYSYWPIYWWLQSGVRQPRVAAGTTGLVTPQRGMLSTAPAEA